MNLGPIGPTCVYCGGDQDHGPERACARPIGVLTVAGPISDETSDRLRDEWKAIFERGDNVGRVAILGDGFTFTTLREQPAAARCGYCGRYGALGSCDGCGAPNAPVQPPLDVTHMGSRRRTTLPARRPNMVRK